MPLAYQELTLLSGKSEVDKRATSWERVSPSRKLTLRGEEPVIMILTWFMLLKQKKGASEETPFLGLGVVD